MAQYSPLLDVDVDVDEFEPVIDHEPFILPDIELLKRQSRARVNKLRVPWIRLRTILIKYSLRLRQIFWRATLGRWFYIKRVYGSCATEISTMQFVANNTTIPVPRVWLHLAWRGREYMVMNRICGDELENVWENMATEVKEAVVEQLAGFVTQLRSLPSPHGNSVCSLLGGAMRDHRLHTYEPAGPFRNEHQMNLQLRRLRPAEEFPEHVALSHAQTHPIVFTHGDLAPRNIMIQGDTITAILDWESAGWFPSHWEYCKARFGSFDYLAPYWDPWIPKFIPQYEKEHEADSYLVADLWLPTEHARD